jgi:DNA-binding MarR family transcriptional regulator
MSMLIMSKLTTPLRPDLLRRRAQTQAFLDLARIRHASEGIVDDLLRANGLEGVTPAQANALLALIDARRPLTAAELARELSLSEVTVGRFVRALEAGGWVERTPDPADARALRLRPTARTREALTRFVRVSNELLDLAFAGMDEAAVDRLCGALAEVRERLDQREKSRTSGSSGAGS